MSSEQIKWLCVVGFLILFSSILDPFLRFYYWELSGGVLSAIVLAIFFVSYYYLFYWRDFYTALEIAVIGWLLAGINATYLIVEFYRTIASSHPQPIFRHPLWVLAIVQFISTQMVLLTPAVLSVPFVWFYLRRRRKMRLRFNFWILMPIALVFLDAFIHLVVFVPLWIFFLIHTR